MIVPQFIKHVKVNTKQQGFIWFPISIKWNMTSSTTANNRTVIQMIWDFLYLSNGNQPVFITTKSTQKQWCMIKYDTIVFNSQYGMCIDFLLSTFNQHMKIFLCIFCVFSFLLNCKIDVSMYSDLSLTVVSTASANSNSSFYLQSEIEVDLDFICCLELRISNGVCQSHIVY